MRHVTCNLDTVVAKFDFHWALGHESAFDVKFCQTGTNWK